MHIVPRFQYHTYIYYVVDGESLVLSSADHGLHCRCSGMKWIMSLASSC